VRCCDLGASRLRCPLARCVYAWWLCRPPRGLQVAQLLAAVVSQVRRTCCWRGACGPCTPARPDSSSTPVSALALDDQLPNSNGTHAVGLSRFQHGVAVSCCAASPGAVNGPGREAWRMLRPGGYLFRLEGVNWLRMLAYTATPTQWPVEWDTYLDYFPASATDRPPAAPKGIDLVVTEAGLCKQTVRERA
jgi:hypothetical protein